jgi:protein-S-isoprenylcysteine O-methyltransferase Ste14
LALHELGRQYSAFITIQPEHELVRSGPYRLIRHPFYLGQMLIVPGIMLTFRSPVAVLIFAASLVFVLKRIRREEQVLLGEFSDEYRDYQRHSWRLVPWLY